MSFIKSLSLLCLIIFQLSSIASICPDSCSSKVTVNALFGGVICCVGDIPTSSLKTGSGANSTIPDTIPIYSCKGIPFAEEPVGPLRFKPAVPKNYTGITPIDATNYKNPCIGLIPLDNPLPNGVPDESCLYLNVWTPTINSSANLPVMIWIYGGAFSIGSSSQQLLYTPSFSSVFDGSQLSLRNVVVVSFNYRLGVFGFLYGNSSEAPGNAGYWDQAEAIKWVKQYISSFGGNPNDITLFGQSAGSMSVSNHIVSPVTRNLFKKAIMQSGASYSKYFSQDPSTAYTLARDLADSVGCTDEPTFVQCLKNKSALTLYSENTEIQLTKGRVFTPIYGDTFMPKSIPKALNASDFNKDIIILEGHVEMEGTFLFLFLIFLLIASPGRYLPVGQTPIVSRDSVKSDIEEYMNLSPLISGDIAQKYIQGNFLQFINPLNSDPIRRVADHAYSDYILVCPTILFGAYFYQNCGKNNTVYQYRLTSKHSKSICYLSNWCDVTHTDDLALVFGQPFKCPDFSIWTDEDRNFSKQIMDIWVYFAINGRPPMVNNKTWPPYTLKQDGSVSANYLELNSNPSIMGNVYYDRYRGNNVDLNGKNFTPSCINDCFGFMNKELLKEYDN